MDKPPDPGEIQATRKGNFLMKCRLPRIFNFFLKCRIFFVVVVYDGILFILQSLF